MVVTQTISSLVPKLRRPPAGQRTKRLSSPPAASSDPEHSSKCHIIFQCSVQLLNLPSHPLMTALSLGSAVQTGSVMGIVFAAFVMGVCLMGGLWCIYCYTGNEISVLPSLKSCGAKYVFTQNPKSCNWTNTTFDIWALSSHPLASILLLLVTD